MIRETFVDDFGNEMIIVDNPDGSYWSGLKSTYDAEQTAKEQSGTL